LVRPFLRSPTGVFSEPPLVCSPPVFESATIYPYSFFLASVPHVGFAFPFPASSPGEIIGGHEILTLAWPWVGSNFSAAKLRRSTRFPCSQQRTSALLDDDGSSFTTVRNSRLDLVHARGWFSQLSSRFNLLVFFLFSAPSV